MHGAGEHVAINASVVGSFFYGKRGKANERSGHLIVSDYRRRRPRATPEEL